MKRNGFCAVVAGMLLLALLLGGCGIFRTNLDDESAGEESAVDAGENTAPREEEGSEAVLEEAPNPAYEQSTEKEADENGASETLSGAAQEGIYQSQPLPTQAYPNDAPYDDNYFEEYGVNPMIDTEDDNLSTFAIDVDTGSFTIARRYLEDGYLPEPDSVRVEEFVNYFDQGYDSPGEHQAFSIHLDGAPTPFTQTERYQVLRVGLQGYAVEEEDRKDASLTFVIDVSGSMEMEQRLEMVKHALDMLVDQLGSRDRVAIVVYGTEARVVLEPTSAKYDDEIMDAIDSLEPEGSTNAEAGLILGYEMALMGFNPEGINRVILCSDGVANVGNTGAESIWEQIDAYASEGIYLTTVGFGMGNYNDVLMEQLADRGDGFYAYVDTFDEAERLFEEDLTSTLQVIARDVKVQVEFNPDVVSRYRLIGYENRDVADEDFRDDSVDAGEVGAGHSVTALYEVKLYAEESGEIANVMLRWEDPESGEVTEVNESIHTHDLADDFEDADPYFQWDVLTAAFADRLRGSYWAEEVEFDDLLDEFERLEEWFWNDDERESLVEMVETADWLTR